LGERGTLDRRVNQDKPRVRRKLFDPLLDRRKQLALGSSTRAFELRSGERGIEARLGGVDLGEVDRIGVARRQQRSQPSDLGLDLTCLLLQRLDALVEIKPAAEHRLRQLTRLHGCGLNGCTVALGRLAFIAFSKSSSAEATLLKARLISRGTGTLASSI